MRISGQSARRQSPARRGLGRDVLGFRGYVISTSSDDATKPPQKAGLPETFRVAAGALASIMSTAWFGIAGTGRARRLRMRPSGCSRPRQSLWMTTSELRQGGDQWRRTAHGRSGRRGRGGGLCDPNTAYKPGFLEYAERAAHNNCYNYAITTDRTRSHSPAGSRGIRTASCSVANVGTAANWDGCKATCSGPNKRVALVIWPGRDYHWYRLHSNGFWGHKPGGTAARNTDNRVA